MFSKIKDINFNSGIRAKDIDWNFEFLDHKLDNVRLYTAGKGIVCGFDMELVNRFQVKISPGICVNSKGEEIEITENTIINIAYPDYSEITEKALVKSDGSITLSHIPYEETKLGYIDETYLLKNKNKISITDYSNVSSKMRPTNMYKNIVFVDAVKWGGKYANVKYKYSYSRIDTVVINSLGDIKIYKGVMSASPSKTNLDNCKEEIYVIGYVEVVTDYDSYLILHQNKDVRPIYVSKDNEIYFYGKKYEDCMIAMEKPLNPKPYDLWYDKENNLLMVYYPMEDGTYAWIPVGTNIPVKEIKLFSPDEWPEDSQTFIFKDTDTNVFFEPNTNAIEVIIDNAPVMSDQFKEVISDVNQYTRKGIGFKLVDPLDRPTVVECRVNHIINATPTTNIYKKTSIVTSENYIIFDSNINIEKIFETDYDYITGEQQLEVFINGKKLVCGLDFKEINKDKSETSSNEGNPSNLFAVLVDINDGDIVQYKINRTLATYETMHKFLEPLYNKVDNHENRISVLEEEIKDLSSNTDDKIGEVKSILNELSETISNLNYYYKKTDIIDKKSIPDYVNNNIYNSYDNYIFNADPILNIEGKEEDVITLFYNKDNNSKILIKDADYSIDSEDKNLNIYLNSDLVDANSTVCINIIRFGADN